MPTRTFPQAQKAQRHLCAADPRLASVIEAVGPIRIELDPGESVHASIGTSILYQQLHGKAAATILARLKALYGASGFPSPEELLSTPVERLRACGLSQSKATALLALSERVRSGALPERARIETLTDAEAIEALVQVKGVGPWTAQMFLIFTLGRTDVLPTGDYGVRRGFGAVFGKRRMPTPKELEQYGERWRPFRTAASWYLWRALELDRYKKWAPRE